MNCFFSFPFSSAITAYPWNTSVHVHTSLYNLAICTFTLFFFFCHDPGKHSYSIVLNISVSFKDMYTLEVIHDWKMPFKLMWDYLLGKYNPFIFIVKQKFFTLIQLQCITYSLYYTFFVVFLFVIAYSLLLTDECYCFSYHILIVLADL